MSLVHTTYRSVKSYQVKGTRLTPIFKSTQLQPPGMWGVLLWHRPASVVIQHPDGTDEVVEIQDPTRKAQLLLLSLGLVGSLLIALFYSLNTSRKENND